MQDDGGSAKNVEQLAKMTGADPRLLERFLKQLAAADIIRETDVDEYTLTLISELLATPPGQGVIINVHDCLAVATAKLPEFLQKTNYENPTNKENSAWTFSLGSPVHYFKWVFSPGNERQVEGFQNCMKFKTLGKKWFEMVPVPELFADFKKDDPEAVLMVDIGGNAGHDILNFHKAWPDQPGRLVVEDLPDLIQGLDKDALKPVEALGHDFFKPQPIKGAKAYFLKMVLHDWPDNSCKEILSNIKPALERGYSKVLINEIVVPDRNAHWYETSVDILMMVAHSAAERREKQWRALIESVGLKICKIWECGTEPEKLIEVELA
ncbi:O-demethylpuromycin-O-methyltransferase [Arthrobotrys entomopaga]|nr:O-demethylpuromycin-O-methyltransferase [Arthrobotrys entomopaga]